MKKGGGKRKGNAFEREVCVTLSLWISNGKNKDLLWRSAMSGGRATVHHRKGTKIRQAGDICAVSPEGHEFSEVWFVECKNVRAMNLSAFLIANKGPLAKFWRVAQKQATQHGREPMLIVRSHGPILAFVPSNRDTLRTTPLLTSNTQGCHVFALTDLVANPWRLV